MSEVRVLTRFVAEWLMLEAIKQGARGYVVSGQRLYISEPAVKFHVGNVMWKLGDSRRAEAVYPATDIGLI